VAARKVEQRRRERGRSTHGDWKETREGMGRVGWDWVSVPLGFSPWVSLLYGRGEKNGRLRCTNVKIRRLTWSDCCESPYGGHLLYLLIPAPLTGCMVSGGRFLHLMFYRAVP
jgi:hypothetical protein